MARFTDQFTALGQTPSFVDFAGSEYAGMEPGKQVAVKQAYFDRYVAPRTAADKLDQAAARFNALADQTYTRAYAQRVNSPAAVERAAGFKQQTPDDTAQLLQEWRNPRSTNQVDFASFDEFAAERRRQMAAKRADEARPDFDVTMGALGAAARMATTPNRALWNAGAAAADLAGLDAVAGYARDKAKGLEAIERLSDQSAAFEDGSIAQDVYRGVNSATGQMLPLLASVMSGGAAPMATMGGADAGSSAYWDTLETGSGKRSDALLNAGVQGLAEAAGEAVGAKMALGFAKAAGGRELLQKAAQLAVVEPGSEMATQVLQSGADQHFGTGGRTAGDWNQYAEQLPADLQAAGIGGLVGAPVMGGAARFAAHLPAERTAASASTLKEAAELPLSDPRSILNNIPTPDQVQPGQFDAEPAGALVPFGQAQGGLLGDWLRAEDAPPLRGREQIMPEVERAPWSVSPSGTVSTGMETPIAALPDKSGVLYAGSNGETGTQQGTFARDLERAQAREQLQAAGEAVDGPLEVDDVRHFVAAQTKRRDGALDVLAKIEANAKDPADLQARKASPVYQKAQAIYADASAELRRVQDTRVADRQMPEGDEIGRIREQRAAMLADTTQPQIMQRRTDGRERTKKADFFAPNLQQNAETDASSADFEVRPDAELPQSDARQMPQAAVQPIADQVKNDVSLPIDLIRHVTKTMLANGHGADRAALAARGVGRAAERLQSGRERDGDAQLVQEWHGDMLAAQARREQEGTQARPPKVAQRSPELLAGKAENPRAQAYLDTIERPDQIKHNADMMAWTTARVSEAKRAGLKTTDEITEFIRQYADANLSERVKAQRSADQAPTPAVQSPRVATAFTPDGKLTISPASHEAAQAIATRLNDVGIKAVVGKTKAPRVVVGKAQAKEALANVPVQTHALDGGTVTEMADGRFSLDNDMVTAGMHPTLEAATTAHQQMLAERAVHVEGKEVESATPQVMRDFAQQRGTPNSRELAAAAEPVPQAPREQDEAVWEALYDPAAAVPTADQVRAAFEALASDPDGVKGELNKLTKDQLKRQLRGHVWADEKKADLVDRAYRNLIEQYAFIAANDGVVSFSGVMKDRSADVRARLARLDDAGVQAYAERVREAAAERQKARDDMLAGLENPQTLDDFRRVLNRQRREGQSEREAYLSLTPEQRARYDALAAEATKDARERKLQAERNRVQVAQQTTGANIIETKHTKKGHDLFVVQLGERVDRDSYNTLNVSAKRMGGYYSSFRGGGAVPGFQFPDRAAAEAFAKLAQGDTSAASQAIAERRDAFAEDKSQSGIERLRSMAERLDELADESLGRERKANTARRARMAGAAEQEARKQQAMAATMRRLADAVESGKSSMLGLVRQKVQVEMLESMLGSAHWAELDAKYPSGFDRQKHQGERPTTETAAWVDWPEYRGYRSDLANMGRALLQIDGAKKLGERLLAAADDVSAEYLAKVKENPLAFSPFRINDGKPAVFSNREQAEKAIARSGLRGRAIVYPVKRGENLIVMSPSHAAEQGLWGKDDKRIVLSDEFGRELAEKLAELEKTPLHRGLSGWHFISTLDKRKRLSAMGIETASELRTALREYVELRKQPDPSDKIKDMERAMVGRKADGLDFFPTPADTVQRMLDAAELSEHLTVLEPSAGMGHIAEQIRAAGVEPDVIEFSPDRRELLEAKGFRVVGTDFLEAKPNPYTYGDVFRAPDGSEGVMAKGAGMDSNRVQLEDEQTGKSLGWFTRSELEPVRHRQHGNWGGYDRILMNPPFSDRRDAAHVQHAYGLLKAGGRLVAIMGEGVFFGQDKKAQAFREWLESVGGSSEQLEAGTFMDKSLPVNTGVAARMVVIEKPAGEALQSRSAERTTHTPEQIRAALPAELRALEQNGTLRLVNTHESGAAGFFDGDTLTLVADRLTPDSALPVLLHEVGHKSKADGGLFGKAESQLLAGVRAWAKLHPALHDKIMARVARSGETGARANEETLMYAIEEAAKAGTAPRWLDKALTALKSWVVRGAVAARFKLPISLLTPDVLVKLARHEAQQYAKARVQGEATAQVAYSDERTPAARAADWMGILSRTGDMFQHPVAPESVQSLADVARIVGQGRIRMGEPIIDRQSGDKNYVLTMPDGNQVSVVETPNGYVYIDASQLQATKSKGSLLYSIVGNYAYNTGKVFAGDPADLSIKALFRRTENMASLALKFGTARFLHPHVKQMNPAGAHGFDPVKGKKRQFFWQESEYPAAELVTPLQWSDNDAENVQSLLETSYANTVALVPEVADVRYDFEHRQFVDGSGEVVTDDDFDAIATRAAIRLSEQGMEYLVSEGARRDTGSDKRTVAGSATLKTAALYQSILNAAGSQAAGRPVLDQISRQLRRDGLDASLAGIRYSKPVEQDWDAGSGAQRIAKQGGRLADSLPEAYAAFGRAALAAMPVHWIVKAYADKLPALKAYRKAQSQQAGLRMHLQAQGDDRLNQARTAFKALPARQREAWSDALAETMNLATVWGIDADSAVALPASANNEQRAIRARLNQAFDAMPASLQQLYRDLRGDYQRMAEQAHAALQQRIERDMAGNPSAMKRMRTELQAEFDQRMASGVYFPLGRHGDYVVSAKSADGRRVTMFAATQAEAARMAQYLDDNGYTGSDWQKRDPYREMAETSPEFVRGVLNAIDDQDMADETRDALLDDLNQLFIRHLPDTSARKAYIHRKNVPGAGLDALQNYAGAVARTARMVGNLQHGDAITGALAQARKQALAEPAGANRTELQDVVASLEANAAKAAEALPGWTGKLNEFGYLMTMAGNLSTGLVNMTQVPLVSLPWLGGQYGAGKAAAALAKAGAQLLPTVRGADRVFFMDAERNPNLADDERAMLKQLTLLGKRDMSQAHDLIREAQTGQIVGKSQVGRVWDAAMHALGYFMRSSELINRDVTALAAYRLAKAAKPSAGMAELVDEVADALDSTQFDYSRENRARISQGAVGQVAFLFKNYAMNMAALQGQLIGQALRGATGKDKARARRALLLMGGVQLLAAGATGAPIAQAGAAVTAALGNQLGGRRGMWLGMTAGYAALTALLLGFQFGLGDDDEPFNAHAEIREMAYQLGAMAGSAETLGDVIARGMPTLLGWDISGRISQQDLLVRDNSNPLSDTKTQIMQQIAGMFGGAPNIAIDKAAKALDAEGEFNALRELSPAFLANPLKAAGLAMNGVTTRDGTQRLGRDGEAVTADALDVFNQAVGLRPADIAREIDYARDGRAEQLALGKRASDLKQRAAEAYRAGDREAYQAAVAAIKAYNDKRSYTPDRISGRELKQEISRPAASAKRETRRQQAQAARQ